MTTNLKEEMTYMLREYEKPELNLVALNTEDIVVTSWNETDGTGKPASPTLGDLMGGTNNGGGF